MRKIRISPINLLWAFLFGFVSVWAQEPAPEEAGEGVDTVVGEPVRKSVLDVLSEGDVSGEDAPEGESGSQSNVGGLRGILDILTPEEQPGSAESVSEEKRTEQDKKINELRRIEGYLSCIQPGMRLAYSQSRPDMVAKRKELLARVGLQSTPL